MKIKNISFSQRFLDKVEYWGNKLPHPFMLFVYLAIFIILISFFISLTGVSVEHPETGEEVVARSLLSGEGLHFMLDSMLENFTGFTPLGVILVMMFGIGLAQRVGLIETVMKTTIMKANATFVTYVLVLTGVLGNVASDAAQIIVPPLGAMVFYALGLNPIAGLAAGFAGAAAGFTANFMIAGTDALLSGITTDVAQSIQPDALVTPVDNWFFIVASVFLVVLVMGLVTNRITLPRLGTFDPKYADPDQLEETAKASSKTEIRGIRNAIIAAIVYASLIVIAVIPEDSFLRGEGGSLAPSPLLENIVPIMFLLFVTVSVAYGITVRSVTRPSDVPMYMIESTKDMTAFIVLVFAISQFISYFEWTNLTLILAVTSSEFLEDIGFTGLGLFVAFILLAAILNQFITSGSAQWALMAPVFVPLFMLLGYEPAFTQLAYRIGDSAAAVLTPLNPYFIIVLGFMQRYDSRAGIGTMVSLMLPYAFFVLVSWIVFFLIWALLGLPIGPGVDIHL